MPLTKPIPVRIEPALRKRIVRACSRLNATPSAFVRLAVGMMLPRIETGWMSLTEAHHPYLTDDYLAATAQRTEALQLNQP